MRKNGAFQCAIFFCLKFIKLPRFPAETRLTRQCRRIGIPSSDFPVAQ
jgi:hypothetical protein